MCQDTRSLDHTGAHSMGHIGEHVTLDEPAYIHESAWLYGKVYVGPGASIWPNVVTRAETLRSGSARVPIFRTS